MNNSDHEDPPPPTVLPIEEVLDLHSFSPKETRLVVEEYLYQCHRKGFQEVRLIHGRGQGIQRALVRSLLAKSSLVMEFRDALPEKGGWGATLVRLKA